MEQEKRRSILVRVTGKFWRLISVAVGGLAILLSTNLSWASPTVPPDFTIDVVATVDNPPWLQDIQPGQGAFGNYLYYIMYPNEIWRVSFAGGTPSLFATIDISLNPQLAALSFGFDGDLFAVDGQNYLPSKIYRIKPDGSSSLFSTPIPEPTTQSSEGITYSAGGPFGNNLFISEFDNCQQIDGTGQWGNPINVIDSTGARSEFVRLANNCNRLTGLAFGPGGNFGTELYAINTNNGTIYKVAANATYTQFSVNPPIGGAEKLAFGSPQNLFGEHLFVAKDFTGEIYQITPSGQSSIFASGFAGFDYRGVTGLKFSQDKKMLFVTDDVAGTIYVIALPKLSCVGFEPPLSNPDRPVKVNNNRVLPFKAQLFDDVGTPVTAFDIGTDPPLIQVGYDPGTGTSVDVTDQAAPAGHGTSNNQFVFTEDNKWQFNLRTNNFDAAGNYTATMAPGNSYFVEPSCTATFVIE